MGKFCSIDDVAAALPGTVKEIAKKVRSNDSAVRAHLRILFIKGLAHISKERPVRNKEPGPTWADGPAGPDSPPQPDFKPRKPRDIETKSRQPVKPVPVTENQTIEQARANPASWLSALGG